MSLIRRTHAHAALLLVASAVACASPSAETSEASPPPLTRDTPLPAADLQSDLAILRRVYETLHPGLYRYATPAEVAARFDSVHVYFATDRTVGEAFLALTRLSASIRCGHSYPNFWNQPARIQQALFEGRDKLPFEFRWIDSAMIVTAGHVPGDDSPRSGALPRGTKVLAINGVPAASILDSLVPLARADGSNDAKRRNYLGVQGRSQFHAFDVLYPLVFPVRDTLVTLRIRRPGDNADTTMQVALLSAEERRAQGEAVAAVADGAPLWRVEERDGVAIVTMPTWALFNAKWDARQWTDSVMRGIVARGISDLVLDIRGNEGGVDAGNELLARFATSPLRLPRYKSMVRYRKIPSDLAPYLDTWDRSFDDWGRDAVPADSGFFWLKKWDDDNQGSLITPAAPHYGGRVWVLVDASNSSATFQFALAAQQSGLATLVGEPTGGNRRGINGSAFYFVRLPGTGLEVDLPLVAGMPDTAQPDAGVVPDIVVPSTAADVAAGRDMVMAEVMRRIAASR